MSAFSSRTSGYKAGVMLLFFSGIAFIVGYASPYWASAELDSLSGNVNGFQLSTKYHEGMWMICISAEVLSVSTTECESYGVTGFPAWFQVVRVLECVGVIGVVICCIYLLATNCCRSVPGPRSRQAEIIASVTGLLAFVGCMVYVGLRNEKVEERGSITDLLNTTFGISNWTFNWAFYLSAIGSGLVVVAGILIGVNNKPVEPATSSYVGGGATVAMTTVQNQQMMAPNAYPYAAQPQPYVAQPAQPYMAQQQIVKAGY